MIAEKIFKLVLVALGLGFALAFCVIVIPPLLASGDVPGAFAAGFVNPFASGYSLDTIFCAFVLAAWIVYERQTQNVRHGWIAILVSLVPGVATGFALYLLLRMPQCKRRGIEKS